VPSYVMGGTLLGSAGEAEPPRPPTWPALIIESGGLGVGLLLTTMLLLVIRGFRRAYSKPTMMERGIPSLVSVTVLLVIAWGYFAEIQDYILVYVMLMPFGILDRWTDSGIAIRADTSPPLVRHAVA